MRSLGPQGSRNEPGPEPAEAGRAEFLLTIEGAPTLKIIRTEEIR